MVLPRKVDGGATAILGAVEPPRADKPKVEDAAGFAAVSFFSSSFFSPVVEGVVGLAPNSPPPNREGAAGAAPSFFSAGLAGRPAPNNPPAAGVVVAAGVVPAAGVALLVAGFAPNNPPPNVPVFGAAAGVALSAGLDAAAEEGFEKTIGHKHQL